MVSQMHLSQGRRRHRVTSTDRRQPRHLKQSLFVFLLFNILLDNVQGEAFTMEKHAQHLEGRALWT